MVIRTTPCTADALIWRITVSKAPALRSTYDLVRWLLERVPFPCSVLHPNESVRGGGE